MKELSIFVDESGDFGKASFFPSYYLVTFVFHEQKQSVNDEVVQLENSIKAKGFNFDYIHTAPLIRREKPFHDLSIDERRQLLYCIFNFTMKVPVKHRTIAISRRDAKRTIDLAGKLSKEIKHLILSNHDFFKEYDRLIVYYDNGQHELSVILNSIFNSYFSMIEFRDASPQRYCLLQVADFICTMEYLKIKNNENRLSNSEKQFFKPQELKKNFLKTIEKKILDWA